MKPLSSLLSATAFVFLAGPLAGCATQDVEHAEHHPDATTSGGPATMNRGSGGSQMGMMDMQPCATGIGI